jgi:hypothetical protein
LLRSGVVSDHALEGAVVSVTRPQAKQEAVDDRESRWQDAVQKIYPVTINQLTIKDADVTYWEHREANPLHLTHVQVDISNIGNRQADKEYPSDFRIEADVFEHGHIKVEGAVNVLMKPVIGVRADVTLETMPLRDLVALTGRYNVQLTQGILAARGRIEYAPLKKTADIHDFVAEHVKADYVFREHARDRKRREQVAETAKEVHEDPTIRVMVAHGKVLHSELGFVNRSTEPDYRVFGDDVNVEVDNFSTSLADLSGGEAVIKLTGRFMGSGRTVMTGTFRPEKPSPDFDLDVQIVKTEMKSFNNVLRAYTDMDLSKGHMSIFSEISIKNGRVNGYVKPIFKDVEVFDPNQDADKAWTKKVYETVIEGVVALLKNEERQQVAAETDVSGPIPSPRASTWQIVGTLIQNAFFKAILPGLQKEYGKA